eukprot:253852-Rhodomonas_salina.1
MEHLLFNTETVLFNTAIVLFNTANSAPTIPCPISSSPALPPPELLPRHHHCRGLRPGPLPTQPAIRPYAGSVPLRRHTAIRHFGIGNPYRHTPAEH